MKKNGTSHCLGAPIARQFSMEETTNCDEEEHMREFSDRLEIDDADLDTLSALTPEDSTVDEGHKASTAEASDRTITAVANTSTSSSWKKFSQLHIVLKNVLRTSTRLNSEHVDVKNESYFYANRKKLKPKRLMHFITKVSTLSL